MHAALIKSDLDMGSKPAAELSLGGINQAKVWDHTVLTILAETIALHVGRL